MKRILSLILCLGMLAMSSFCYADVTFSTDFFQQYSLYALETDDDGDIFIDSGKTYTTKQKSFTHSFEHPKYYSYIYTDIIVIVNNTTKPYPVARTWIKYNGTHDLQGNSITFSVDGKDYTFSGIGSGDRRSEDEKGYSESMLIKYNQSNIEFINVIIQMGQEIANHADDASYTMPVIPFVIHGAEEISGEMSSASIQEAWLMLVGLYISHGDQCFDRFTGTQLTVTEGGPTQR